MLWYQPSCRMPARLIRPFASCPSAVACLCFHDNGVRMVDVLHQRSLWLTFADARRGPDLRASLRPAVSSRFCMVGRTSIALPARTAHESHIATSYTSASAGIDARITGASSGLKYSFIVLYGDRSHSSSLRGRLSPRSRRYSGRAGHRGG